MSGPLEGVRVLDFTQVVAGPFGTVHLADLGADVVKVETPRGDTTRRAGDVVPGEAKYFHHLNRGKRGIVLDLAVERGREVLHRLVRDFDVVVANWRPGVAKRIGADYDTLRQFRADLIYMDVTGYGNRGPMAQRAGSDIAIQAYSGLMAAEGKTNEHGAPAMIASYAPADYITGVTLAMGVCAALYHRQRTGRGQYVGASLLASALSVQGGAVPRMPAQDATTQDLVVKEIRRVRASGGSYDAILAVRGDRFTRQYGLAARIYYGGYKCKDGAILLGAITPENRDQMRSVLGVTDDPSADRAWDPLGPGADREMERIYARFRETLMTRTVDEWIEAFTAAGAPVAKVNIPEEMADDEQVRALGLMVELDHPVSGREWQVGPLLEMSDSGTGTARPSPAFGQHTDDVLRESGFADAEIASLRAAGVVA